LINPNSYAVVSGTLIRNRTGELGKRGKLFASAGNSTMIPLSQGHSLFAISTSLFRSNIQIR